MIFLKIEAKIVGTTVEEVESGDFGSKYAKWIQAKSKLFYESGERDCRFFIASIDDHSLLMGAAARSVPHMEKTLPGFLAAVAIQCEDIRVEEITLSGAEALMILSESNCFIRSRRDIFQDFGLFPLILHIARLSETKNCFRQTRKRRNCCKMPLGFYVRLRLCRSWNGYIFPPGSWSST